MAKVFVPAGTHVDFSVHVLHHREDVWEGRMWRSLVR
jgi:hypothetical protein